MTDPDLIEAIAREMGREHLRRICERVLTAREERAMRQKAKEALAAISDAGYVVVKKDEK